MKSNQAQFLIAVVIYAIFTGILLYYYLELADYFEFNRVLKHVFWFLLLMLLIGAPSYVVPKFLTKRAI